MTNVHSEKGFSIIEILILTMIISVVTLMVVLSIQVYTNMSRQNASNIQTAILFEETAEVIQLLRDDSWDSNIAVLDLDTDYYLHWDGSNYSATSTPIITAGKYERTFSLSEIERDGNDTIVTSGSVDANTLLVNITVRWDDKGEAESRTTQSLIHNVYEN